MSMTDDVLAGLSPEERQQTKDWGGEFEKAWQPDKLHAFFAGIKTDRASVRRAVLEELVKVDLKLQWRAGGRPTLEGYLREYSELGPAQDLSPALLLEELRAREAAGLPIAVEELVARFPAQDEALRTLVAQMKRSGRASGAAMETLAPHESVPAPESAGAAGWSLGSQFGRYRIEKRLGEGAMGSVYLAHDGELDRKVALKIPKFGDGENAELVERFFREARAAAVLRHANICPVYDVGEIEETYYISMAYIAGRPLSDYISPEKLQGEREIAILVRKLALALEDAHSHKIVHRDLKPDNIMIDAKNEPVIMDFGLARQTNKQNETRVTQSGTMLGTPAYMSPEQVEGDLETIGAQSDVYSLGVILYELCTGTLPFTGSMASVLGQIMTKEPAKPSTIQNRLDERLGTICLKMMAKQPDHRFETMKAAANELTRFIKGEIPKPVEKIANLKPDDDAPVASPTKRPAQKTVSGEASPRKTVDPRIERLKAQKVEVESLLDQNQHARAVRLLEAMIKQTAPAAKKYVEWARKQLPRAKEDPERIRRESDSAVRTAKTLISRHEFLQAVEMLQQIPEHLRSEDVTKTLERAIELADEVEYLIKDIEEAEQKREFEGLLPSVERLLTLKPSNKLALRLQEELTSYGKGGKLRVGGSDKVYHMGGLAVEAWKIWGSVALLAVIFGGVYAYTVITVTSGERTLKIEIAEGYEDQVQVKVAGEEVSISGDGFGEIRVKPDNNVQFEVHPKGNASFEVVKNSVKVLNKSGQVLRISFVDEKPMARLGDAKDAPKVAVVEDKVKPTTTTTPAGPPLPLAANPLPPTDPPFKQLTPDAAAEAVDVAGTTATPLIPGSVQGAGWFEIPAEFRGACIFTQRKKGEGRTGFTDITAKRDGELYLACSWAYEGNRGGGWWEQRMTADQLEEKGWQEVGKMYLRVHTAYRIFKRSFKKNEKVEIRTNKYSFPYVIVPSDDPGPPGEPRRLPMDPAIPLQVIGKSPMPLTDIPTIGEIPAMLSGATAYHGTGAAAFGMVAQDQTVYLAASWREGGNSQGQWVQERWLKDRVLKEGWQEVGTITFGSKDPGDEHTLFSRAFKKGDVFYIRTRKRSGPIVISLEGAPKAVSTNIFESDEWEWTRPVKLGSAINTQADESDASISADGLTLAFESTRSGPAGGKADIWVSERRAVGDAWGAAKPLGPSINKTGRVGGPHLSADGLTMTFYSDTRPEGGGYADFWEIRRSSRGDAWGEPVNLGPNVNSGGRDYSPTVSADGLTFLLHSARAGGNGGSDLWMSRRMSADAEWDKAVNLRSAINTRASECDPALSRDGLTLLYITPRKEAGDSGKDWDIWMTTRPTVNAAFGRPVNLGPAVNSDGWEGAPSFSGDGRTVYFESSRGGWEVRFVFGDAGEEGGRCCFATGSSCGRAGE